MIHYEHFALPNLYLLNGYREVETPDGIYHEYERGDELELCVGRVLLRKPERLRGWDLRFLRRALALSQPDFGQLVDRDAQTVARWEKSEDVIPTFVELTIRARFAERFEPWMCVEELLTYVDGRAPQLPERIVLHLTDAGWTFDIEPRIKYVLTHAHADFILRLPSVPNSVFKIYEYGFEKNLRGQGIAPQSGISLGDIGLIDPSRYSTLDLPPMIQRVIANEPASLLQVTTPEGNPDDEIRIRRH